MRPPDLHRKRRSDDLEVEESMSLQESEKEGEVQQYYIAAAVSLDSETHSAVADIHLVALVMQSRHSAALGALQIHSAVPNSATPAEVVIAPC